MTKNTNDNDIEMSESCDNNDNDNDFDLCGYSYDEHELYSQSQSDRDTDADADGTIDPITRTYRGFEFDIHGNGKQNTNTTNGNHENGLDDNNDSKEHDYGEDLFNDEQDSQDNEENEIRSEASYSLSLSSPVISPGRRSITPIHQLNSSMNSSMNANVNVNLTPFPSIKSPSHKTKSVSTISPLSIHSTYTSDSSSDSISGAAINNNSEKDEAKPLKYTLELRNEDELTKDDEMNFKYQYDLRVYVNRCLFIRTTKIGKRVGFAPTLPKTTDFVMCWNCNDWIPPGISPPCIPLCSQTHMHAKYVFDKMFGYFCSWGCCKKYIYETMSNANRTKYMRSLLQLRRIFYPDLTNKPIETVEPRTTTKPYGGSRDTEDYYSKMVKINLPPLAEDISLTFNSLSVA